MIGPLGQDRIDASLQRAQLVIALQAVETLRDDFTLVADEVARYVALARFGSPLDASAFHIQDRHPRLAHGEIVVSPGQEPATARRSALTQRNIGLPPGRFSIRYFQCPGMMRSHQHDALAIGASNEQIAPAQTLPMQLAVE